MSQRNRVAIRRYLFAAALLLAGLGAACNDDNDATDLAVVLAEWRVAVADEQVQAGRFTVIATNAGTEPHELVVVKSDFPAAMLPVVDGSVDEAQVRIVGAIEPFAPGATERLEISLSPGKYVLICNIAARLPGEAAESHYLNGMSASLLVRQ